MSETEHPAPRTSAPTWRSLVAGPAAAAVIAIWSPGDDPRIAWMAAVAAWMAVWWVTEAVPIAVTSLLPLVLLPVLGVAPIKQVAPNYGKPTIFLFLGGFLLALGLQGSGVHRRLALRIVHTVGGQPRRLVLGFMIASAALSMWISNTATVMVLMPIGLAVLAAARDRAGDVPELKKMGVAIMLAIAYAADIGGMATPVGTPPNLAYRRQLVLLFPNAPAPSFPEWMMLGLPVTVCFLLGGWLLLTRVTFRMSNESLLGSREVIDDMRAQLGPVRRDEWVTAMIFAVTAVLWLTRAGLDLGDIHLPGWSELPFLRKGFVDDAVVAVAMALVLFLWPSHDRPGERLLTWGMAKKLPWGMLLLFGGGFALADGFKTSGLSAWVGHSFQGLAGTPPLLLVVVVCVVLTFLTELTSNTATTELVLPILGSASVAMHIDPRILMIPATLSASCAFMMPVASPTQAIVFGSGWVPIRDMVRAGIWFNILGVLLVTLAFALLGGAAMGIDFGAMPAWAVMPGK